MLVVLALVGVAGAAMVNVALNGTALQSSSGWGGVAGRAIDGNDAARYNQGSCTHSRYGSNNWWSVQLPGFLFAEVTYPVTGVTIVNRDDCCQSRISGAQVYVGETLCGTVTHVKGTKIFEVVCPNGTNGTTVTVKQSKAYLTLCEVKVWVDEKDLPEMPAYTNVALKGAASASSVGWSGVAARAVDGATSGTWRDNSCTHSRYKTNNWWKLDLEGSDDDVVYPVSMVVVYNREDCCQDRINGAEVYVGEELCGTVTYVAGQASYKVQCASTLSAGSVTVKQAANYLTLCEVEIYVADDALPKIPFYNAAVGAATTQTSTGWGGVASRAIDGNTNGQWSGASCTHTRGAGQSWAATLSEAVQVDHVIIYNRLDCCQNRINGAEVWVGSTKCGSVVYTDTQQAAYRVKCPVGTEGTVVTVKAAAGQYLTLCEVKIMAATEEMGTEMIDEEEE